MTSETQAPQGSVATHRRNWKTALGTQPAAHVARAKDWMMRLLACLYIAFTMSLLAASLTRAAPPAASDLVKASILADTTAVQPGQPFRIGLLLKIAPQWHVYWQNPGEGGIPTTVSFRLPDGFVASPVQYPVPMRFALQGGLYAYGYEDQVMLM